MASTNKSLLLSFDDGPLPQSALMQILGVLTAKAIRAEFYLLGEEVESSPTLAIAIVKAGHSIQNHSWNHPKSMDKLPIAMVREQIEKTQKIIEKMTGITPTKFRPPYGSGGWPRSIDPEIAQVAKEYSLAVRNWDIDTGDWKIPKGLATERQSVILDDIKRHPKDSLNVLLHVQSATAQGLSSFIERLGAAGCSFLSPQVKQ